MKKKYAWAILGLFVISISASIFGHYYASRSEPFRAASEFVRRSDEVQSQLGNIRSVNLGFFGYSIRYSGPLGRAEFKIDAIGDKKTGVAFIRLRRDLGVWKVTGATLDGKVISAGEN